MSMGNAKQNPAPEKKLTRKGRFVEKRNNKEPVSLGTSNSCYIKEHNKLGYVPKKPKKS